jgi:anti-sigma B factor antagonist
MSMTVVTHWDGHRATVTAAGDVDLATVPPIDAAIEAAVRTVDVEAVLVDLSGVTFLDSSGISVLLRGRRLADERHLDYRIAGAQGPVRTVLELTGVWPHLSGQG